MNTSELPAQIEDSSPSIEGLVQNPFVAGLETAMIPIVDELGSEGALQYYESRLKLFASKYAEDPAFSDHIEAAQRFGSYWAFSQSKDLASAAALYATFELNCRNDTAFAAEASGNSIWHEIADVAERLRMGDNTQEGVQYLLDHGRDTAREDLLWGDSNSFIHNGELITFVDIEDEWSTAKETGNRLGHVAMYAGLRDLPVQLTKLARDKQDREDRWLLYTLRKQAGISIEVAPRQTWRDRGARQIAAAVRMVDLLFVPMVEADRQSKKVMLEEA